MIKITVEQYEHDPKKYLDIVKPGVRIEIGDLAVLIHPRDLRYLEKCSEVIDSMPMCLDGE